MIPIDGHFVVDATRRHAHSALPDAPQHDERPERPRRVRRTRGSAARMLRRLADWLEPPRCPDRPLRPYPR